MASHSPHERPKILVVEDEFIIALDLSETVQDLGYDLEGPFEGNEEAVKRGFYLTRDVLKPLIH